MSVTLYSRQPVCAVLALFLAGSGLYTLPTFAINRFYDRTLPRCTDTFSDANCWRGGIVPGSGDNVFFDSGLLISPYTLFFTTPTTSNAGAFVNNDNLVWNLGGNNYSLSADLTVGQHSGDLAALELTNGSVRNSIGYIGLDAGANGSVTVSGPDSGWINSSSLRIGSSGTGNLDITTGGTVNNTTGDIGYLAGGRGVVRVDGKGSFWNNSGYLSVGATGSGAMTVSNGASVQSSEGYIGRFNSATGNVTVDGIGSLWNVGSSMYLGGSATASGGAGTLTVQNSGVVDVAGDFKLWSGGTLNLNGGSVAAGSFDGGTGTLNFTDGELIVNGGMFTDGSSALTINGATALDNPGLTLNNGAFADYASSVFSISLNKGQVMVGGSTRGRLNLNGGSVLQNSSTAYLGFALSGNGSVTVAGGSSLSASTWNISTVSGTRSDLYVGALGKGNLDIIDGGLVLNGATYIGSGQPGIGHVTVSGVDAVNNRQSRWRSSKIFLGESGTGNLGIFDGGFVAGSLFEIGSQASGSGVLTIDGINSVSGLASTLELTGSSIKVGVAGNGGMSVTSGGQVLQTLSNAVIGDTGGSGTVTISGVDPFTGQASSWTGGRSIIVGKSGTGVLDISDGGSVSSGGVLSSGLPIVSFIGKSPGGVGTVSVSGVNTATAQASSWSIDGGINVGDSGTGTLNINSGGKVSSGDGVVGARAGGIGSVTVSGPGAAGSIASSWVSSSGLVVGGEGNGTLDISGGGLVSNQNGLVGDQPGAIGSVSVSGFDTATGDASSWINSLSLVVGGLGTGSLSINGGGFVQSPNGVIGNDVGGSGSVTVNGVDSLTGQTSSWINSLSLVVGGLGTGSLSINGGGFVQSPNGVIGNDVGGSGSVTVNGVDSLTGQASSWINSASLVIGNADTGILNINAGGLVDSLGGIVGDQAGSSGSVIVSGVDAATTRASSWINGSAGLLVGNSGTGLVNIESGGSVSSESGILGGQPGGNGSVIVSGMDAITGKTSLWTVNSISGGGVLSVGSIGNGVLEINVGGAVRSGTAYIGELSGGSGSVVVNGIDSTTGQSSSWVNSASLVVGNRGSGTLDINNGGSVSSADGLLGSDPGSNGVVTVNGVDASTGKASAWSNSGQLVIGGGLAAAGGAGTASGELNISFGGEVASNDSYLGLQGNGLGSVMVSGVDINTGRASSLTNSGLLVVGESGHGVLGVDSGGSVSSFYGLLGNQSGGYGSVTVSGMDSASGLESSWTSTGIVIGGSGLGGLVVDGGGSVISQSSSVGETAGGSGQVTVKGVDAGSGRASSWESGVLFVGENGSGLLNILGGGLVSSAQGSVGGFSGSNGVVTVSGVDAVTGKQSTWVNKTGPLDIGKSNGSSGALNISGGGSVVTTGPLYFGKSIGSSGAGTVSGVDSSTGQVSSLDIAQSLYVGSGGAGTLQVESGAYAGGNAQVFIGSGSQSSGTVTVTGIDASSGQASLLEGTIIVVGDSGPGALNIINGGSVRHVRFATQVFNSDGFIGLNTGGNGIVTVGGANPVTGGFSTWKNGDSLYIGGNTVAAAGTGTLNIDSGGLVEVANMLKVWNTGAVNLNGGMLRVGSLNSEGSVSFAAGELSIGNDLLMDTSGPLGSSFNVSGVHTLSVGGTTTLSGASRLTLDGGTFSTGALVDNGGFSFNSGTLNLTSDNLVIGDSGIFGSALQAVNRQTINVTNTTRVDSNGLLYVNGGKFTSGNLVNNGQVAVGGLLSELGGSTISNNGLLNGDGRISAVLNNNIGAEVQVGSGDTLRFTAVGNRNSGQINLSGGSVRFDQDLTNVPGGIIAGRGTLYTTGGLVNQGHVGFSGGMTDVHGDVNNAPGAAIIVSGNGTVTFYDDLIHNGSEVRISGGSSAVFFGAVSGAGAYTGTGSLFFEGDLNPGNSPALVSTAGDMALGINSRTIMEIGGLSRGSEYDAFDVAGSLSLAGTLETVFFDTGGGLFTPMLGDSFDLFRAETISGTFDVLALAALSLGLDWKLDYLTDFLGTTDVVRLSVVTASAVPLPTSVWLFGAGLLGLIAVGRRPRRSV